MVPGKLFPSIKDCVWGTESFGQINVCGERHPGNPVSQSYKSWFRHFFQGFGAKQGCPEYFKN
jgi:hypothetical protein